MSDKSRTARTGQAPAFPMPREDFAQRFRAQFTDPAFDAEADAIARLEAIAWDGYEQSRKSPRTRKAGPGHADPDYDLSIEWAETSERLKRAQAAWSRPETPSRVLVINGTARNDGSCPGEMSKSFRFARLVEDEVRAAGLQPDLLDLSLIISDYRRHIHPCKGCVSTAMPLCHWPCSCYPNHALGQVDDWMNEIYERWVSAHGVVIVCATHWYQAPTVLKAMIDRLVCADGGNPDPTSTHGKTVDQAKALELAGWPYPKHLAGRAYGVVVHGDVAGVESLRRNLCDWLDWMGLVDAGSVARLDRYVGYYEPYATSHEGLDRDEEVQQEVRNVGRALVHAVGELRAGRLAAPKGLPVPRPK